MCLREFPRRLADTLAGAGGADSRRQRRHGCAVGGDAWVAYHRLVAHQMIHMYSTYFLHRSFVVDEGRHRAAGKKTKTEVIVHCGLRRVATI